MHKMFLLDKNMEDHNQQQAQHSSESGLFDQMGFPEQVFLLKQMTWVLWHIFVLYQALLLAPAGQFKPLFGASHLLPADTDQQLVEKFGEENNLHHKVP